MALTGSSTKTSDVPCCGSTKTWLCGEEVATEQSSFTTVVLGSVSMLLNLLHPSAFSNGATLYEIEEIFKDETGKNRKKNFKGQ
jgi:hypothetical protein